MVKKAKYVIAIGITLLFFGASIVQAINSQSNQENAKITSMADWWDLDWYWRKEITIDHTQVAMDLPNFPVAIAHTSTDLKDYVQPDGDDIAFIADDGTQLNHEIETYIGATGELVAWVHIPLLSSTSDTTLYMYYGNPSASNQASPEQVWDTGYTHVWHMDGTDDSTSNNHDLTNHGATTTTGIIGSAYDFEKSETDYFTYGDNTISHAKPMCMELWFSMESTATGDYYGMMSMRDQYAIDLIQRKNAYTTVPDNCMYGGYKDLSVGWHLFDTGSNSVSTSTWYHVAFAIDSAGNAQIFLNGVGKESGSGLGVVENTDWNSGIGAYFSSSISHHFDGVIDEVRISDVTRSAERIETQYTNINNPAGFISVGSQEGTELLMGELTGGLFKASFTLRNTGVRPAENIHYDILVTGGFIITGQQTTGTIPILSPGSDTIIKSNLIIGIGRVILTQKIELPPIISEINDKEAFVLLFLII